MLVVDDDDVTVLEVVVDVVLVVLVELTVEVDVEVDDLPEFGTSGWLN